MNDIFDRGLRLFDGIIYESINRYPTFIHIKSIFSDEWYNFIVPIVQSGRMDWTHAEIIINLEKINGYSLSYYVPESLLSDYVEYFASNDHNKNLGSDVFSCKQVLEKYTPLGELTLVDDETITTYIRMAKTCFPDWANNEEYAIHMYDHQKNNKQLVVQNYLLKHNDTFVGFCGMICSQKDNLAYFHNTGVLPEFRRKGYFNAIIQHLINTVISLKISDTYALVENESGSYYGLSKLGFTVEDKYHLFSI